MRRRHFALAVIAAALYATCYLGIKVGLAYAPPLHFGAWRATLGGGFLLAMHGARRGPLLPPRRLWMPTALLAVVGPILGFLAMFMSPRYTGAGLASVLGNMGPLWIIGFSGAFLAEPLSRRKLAALALAITGVTIVAVASGASPLSGSALGILLPLLASMSGAAESLIIKWARPEMDTLSVAAWQYLLAAAVLLALAALFEPREPIVWTRSFVVVLVILAGGATAAATGLWYWLVQRDEVSRLSLVLFLVPVAGLAAGRAFFDEQIAAGQAIGALVILAGVGVAGLDGARRGMEPRSSRA